MPGTEEAAYAHRLESLTGARWKRLLNVQAPYRWNLRRQDLGRTLDVGCGIGRNLAVLEAGSIGLDHNERAIEVARGMGLDAYTTTEWEARAESEVEAFDALLVAHVLEHMSPIQGRDLLCAYLPFVRPGGKVFLVCPQERGYASDMTHESWTTGTDLETIARDVGLDPQPWRSFPLPRMAGSFFTYNEFTLLAHKPL
jgi:2-polyprenyl-3-methyl-5-hydroxy-6-metoxy-1,4-benzoquinol methylase